MLLVQKDDNSLKTQMTAFPFKQLTIFEIKIYIFFMNKVFSHLIHYIIHYSINVTFICAGKLCDLLYYNIWFILVVWNQLKYLQGMSV